MSTINPSRREVIAAVAIMGAGTAAASSLIAAPAITDRTAWERAVRACNGTREAWQRFNFGVHDPLHEEHARLKDHQAREWARRSEYRAAGKRSDDLCATYIRAQADVLKMPAPDLAALRWKLEYLTDEDAGGHEDFPNFAEELLADVQRLLPEAR